MFKEMLAFVRAEDDATDHRKLERMKKKLANLEVERCQRKLAQKDLAAIDDRINKTKLLYTKCCEETHVFDQDAGKLAQLKKIKEACQEKAHQKA
ncbi:hypothetical protein [Streptococcus sp. DD12]|uniref:hypothetical protein n=1 Tax=Streptococcus sp. DD12 TaxID=1777880 RepID=UPI0007925296|nr:hypothetical protein [Streptococcus sp. DD12]KXT75976.1 hypothetical protein STRDD12_01088 [Streptococcus sp. DD12]